MQTHDGLFSPASHFRALSVFDANCCGQFIARTAQIRIVSTEFVHEAHEGVGDRI
jgi:hypothetical protein